MTNIKILQISLRNGMTTEGFDYLCKLKHLNEIIIERFSGLCEVFNDINLSPEVIKKFVNIKNFKLNVNIKPVDGMKGLGFLYIKD